MNEQHIHSRTTGTFLQELGYQFYHMFDFEAKVPLKITHKWEIISSRFLGVAIILLMVSLLMIFHRNYPETAIIPSLIIGISGFLVALPFLMGVALSWIGKYIRTYWIFFLFVCYITCIPALLFLAAYYLPGNNEFSELLPYILTGSSLCWLGATFSTYHLLKAGQETEITHHKPSLPRMLLIIFWLACILAGLVFIWVTFRQ